MKTCGHLEQVLSESEKAFYKKTYYCTGCEHAGFYTTRQIRPNPDKPGIFLYSVELCVTCDFHVKNYILAQKIYRSEDCVEMDEEGDILTVVRWCDQKTKPQKGSGKNGELETE